MKTFILLDSNNLLNRAKFVTSGSIDIKLGMTLHIMFNSIKKVWNKFEGSHLVFAFEGKSWRKSYYKPYKANRKEKRALMTPKELEEEKLFFETFAKFQEFITEQTNCTTLQHQELEADDLIAGFIQSHPNDNHVIVSTDTDFYQLISPNVMQYNGITDTLTTYEGIFDKEGAPLLDKKTNEPVGAPEPEWLLFEKCIRGDSSDNVFSAYPGVRTKGTKNKVGLRDAFDDRHDKGWAWNNIMNATWKDPDDNEHIVQEDYNRNKILIDLSAQPEDIRVKIFETILEKISDVKIVPQVGIRFMKFCALYDLKTIGDYSDYYVKAFQTGYPYE